MVDSTSGTNHVSSAQASAVAADRGVDTVNVDLGRSAPHQTAAPAQDGVTGTPAAFDIDLDQDGFGDAMAADHNNDGHVDEVSVDINHDGVADATYTDTNFDGHTDQVAYDTNGDGVADQINIDDNFDGRVDVQHQDTDGDGHIDTILVDQDHDGYADGMFTDADGDGMIDDFSAGHSDNIAPMIDDFGTDTDDLHQVGHDDMHDGGDTIGV